MREIGAAQTIEQKMAALEKANVAMTPELRKEYWKKAIASWTPEKRRQHGKNIYKLSLGKLTHQQLSEYGRRAQATMTPEQRRANGRRMREKARRKPNGLENTMITLLQELAIYAELADTAQEGQVYYADNFVNRRTFRKGDVALNPDFKVKGLPIVFEIHGTVWHTKEGLAKMGLQRPEWRWNVPLLKAMYAERGLTCYVYWDYELAGQVRREEIKREIAAIITAARE